MDRRSYKDRTSSAPRRAAGPGRTRSAPPSRRDSRRPGGALRRPERDRLPRYWFAERLLLTLSGQRPVHVLLGHALPIAYDRLIELAPHAPLRPAAAYAGTPAVRHCDEFRPQDGVIEAFARIVSGERLRALAFRLELGEDARWRCAAFELESRT